VSQRNKYDCMRRQTLRGHSPGGSTLLSEMTSWPLC